MQSHPVSLNLAHFGGTDDGTILGGMKRRPLYRQTL